MIQFSCIVYHEVILVKRVSITNEKIKHTKVINNEHVIIMLYFCHYNGIEVQ